MFDITNFIIIAGAIGSAISGFAMIVPAWRKWKQPKPPVTPSCVIFTGVEMQRPDGLFGHRRRSRDRLL